MAKDKKTKSLQFEWEGTNRKGQKVKGETSGPNLATVKAQLRNQVRSKRKQRHYSASVVAKK